MLVQKGIFNIPYFICSLSEHSSLKPILLNLIENAPGKYSVQKYETISKSDWFLNQNGASFRKNLVESKEDNYFKVLLPYMQNIIENVIPDKNKQNFFISQAWYQQYKKMNYYFYHDHPGVRWAVVYYLELPSDGPKTEFEDFLGKSHTPDVKEGDMLVFPGWMKHRSPPNKSNDRKTVIAFNIVEKENPF